MLNRTAIRVAVLFVGAGVACFVAGTILQKTRPGTGVDIHLHDTYIVVAEPHLYTAVAVLLALFSGFYLLIPALSRYRANRIMSLLHFILTTVCLAIILLLNYFKGVAGTPRQYYDYTAWESFKQFDRPNYLLGTVIIILVLAQLLPLANILAAVFRRKSRQNR